MRILHFSLCFEIGAPYLNVALIMLFWAQKGLFFDQHVSFMRIVTPAILSFVRTYCLDNLTWILTRYDKIIVSIFVLKGVTLADNWVDYWELLVVILTISWLWFQLILGHNLGHASMMASQISVMNCRRVFIERQFLKFGNLGSKLVIVVVPTGRWTRFSREFSRQICWRFMTGGHRYFSIFPVFERVLNILATSWANHRSHSSINRRLTSSRS